MLRKKKKKKEVYRQASGVLNKSQITYERKHSYLL
jgi:hypothetical protein